MTLLDVLIIGAVLCLMEARNCSRRAKIWDALAEIEDRKLDKKP